MGRGGRGSGGGFRAPGARKAPPPAAPKKAPAPAVQSPSGDGVAGSLGSAILDGVGWGAGTAMAHRAMDRIFGPRTFQIDHTTSQASSSAAPATTGSEPSNACDIHNMAFQDCINHNGSDISKCQFYIDVLNDCRRRGQVVVVQPYA
ncbi:hypothetical protein QOZ80_5BG0448330 [Eleusine coracana subsp. coracana]|nr:hypothetical protein QOZ80_5BG0448330 [Eleusine coracana subsp. coracana]